MRFSYFESFFSNTPQPCTLKSWDEFVYYMRSISDVVGYKPSPDDYDKKQGLISPAIYAEGSSRGNKNVLGWEMVMLDIDDCDISYADILGYFKGYDFIVYSSPNCTKDKLKLRVIIKLDGFAPPDTLSQIWHACNEWCKGIVDTQTKDKSRIMYIPARYTNKGDQYHHIFEVGSGVGLDWEQLIKKYPSPKETDRFVQKNKMSGLKRKIYLQTKTSPVMDIRNRECPFVYPKMLDNYVMTPMGGHHKAIYVFMLQVCTNAQKIGYPLSISELVDMAEQLDSMDGSYYDEKKLHNSAQDAMEFSGL